eukprot:g11292.t1
MSTTKEDRPKIGNYYIGKVIGQGATAVVRLCVHETTKKEYALKIMKKPKVEIKRLESELLALQRLDHPHIVRLKDAYETVSRIWMVLELLRGEELFQKITASEKGLGKETTVKYFYQLLLAVKYLHERGVVHRDLKPSNIMVTSAGIKLVDFGLSAIVQPGQLLKTRCGSPHYVSPEVVRGKEYDGMKSDLWSLGTILFVMACGTMPFVGSNVRAVMKAITVGTFTIPPHVDPEVASLIKSMLKVDPNARASIVEILELPVFKHMTPTLPIPPTPTMENKARSFPKDNATSVDYLSKLRDISSGSGTKSRAAAMENKSMAMMIIRSAVAQNAGITSPHDDSDHEDGTSTPYKMSSAGSDSEISVEPESNVGDYSVVESSVHEEASVSRSSRNERSQSRSAVEEGERNKDAEKSGTSATTSPKSSSGRLAQPVPNGPASSGTTSPSASSSSSAAAAAAQDNASGSPRSPTGRDKSKRKSAVARTLTKMMKGLSFKKEKDKDKDASARKS